HDITATSATLRAAVIAPILGATVRFQYGRTTAYGTTTPAQATTLIDDAERITAPITALAPGTTYHVRAVALSGIVAVYGKDLTFTTAAAVAPALAPDGDGDDAAPAPAPASNPAPSGDAATPAPAAPAP